MYFSSPNPSYAYYRGTPYYGGSGSGGGQAVSGAGVMAQGTGPIGQQTGWSPTILSLFGLVIAEMFFFGLLTRFV